MNCRPGDLALVICGCSAGMAVTCIEVAGYSFLKIGGKGGNGQMLCGSGPIWRVDRPVTWVKRQIHYSDFPYCPDSSLQPIRPDELDVELEEELAQL